MKILKLKHSVSRASDTYGYNIIKLADCDKDYKTVGGGYDMIGTVFGMWLSDKYMDRIKENVIPTVYSDVDGKRVITQSDTYGFFKHEQEGTYWLDGGCGMESMIRIAEKIGLIVTRSDDVIIIIDKQSQFFKRLS